ncbi:alkaline phosphatase family protein [Sinomicrobium sp. M5D2P17]
MKPKKHLLAVILACALCFPVVAENPFPNDPFPTGKKTRKVVFIIVDGLSADMIEKNPTPHLDAIAKRGGYTRAYVGGKKGGYSETPTISAVGYNSLLTGTWVNKHNVRGNSIKAPNYHYPTIYRLLKDRYPSKKTAIFSTWLDNRTKLIGEGLPETGNIKVDYAYDGFELDTLSFPHDTERQYIRNIDKKVALEAARYIEKEGPDLSWVYLEYTDDMGHKYGDSPQLTEAIAFEDRLIGNIWEAIKDREKNNDEEWLFIITTDHGRTEETGHHHGGQSERERSTWIVTNSPDTNDYFREETPAIVDILPTMTDFLDIDLPKELVYEIDGVSLTGELSATHLEGEMQEEQLVIRWKNTGKNSKGTASVLVSVTNNHKTGGKDSYRLLGKVKIKDKIFRYTPDKPGSFYKIVLETPENTLNTWVKTAN